MKSKIKLNKNSAEPKYPCLMIAPERPDRVILFSAPGIGVVVTNNDVDDQPLGYHSYSWVTRDFVPFTGSIKLSNE